MTIQEVLSQGIEKLKLSKKNTSPQLDSEVLLSFVLKKSKEYLYANPEKKISKRYNVHYNALLRQRAKGIPVAYLTGHKEFFGLNFKVNKNVLIPRPETETLVELVLDSISGTSFTRPRILRILDIGTGSGNIIISLAKSLENFSTRRPVGRASSKNNTVRAQRSEVKNYYFASDVSKSALTVAKANARSHKVKIKFKQGSLLSPWKKERLDIIVANLPYGWKEWKNNTSAETLGLKFEPQKALFTNNKGLALYEKLFQQLDEFSPPREGEMQEGVKKTRPTLAPPCLAGRRAHEEGDKKPKYIFVEFDPRQKIQIKKLARAVAGPAYKAKFISDLSKRTRFLLLELSDR
ncbi:MAG: HemK/PrmC family methyltransferase [bacterium]|nr:HemK/PrmC family methyltransferase [bacterium]